MATPINEHSDTIDPIYPTTNITRASSTEENTFIGDDPEEYLGKDGDFHYLDTHTDSQDKRSFDRSPSSRDQETKLSDDLAMLHAERVASSTTHQEQRLHRSMSIRRSRSKHSDPVDQFDVATNPIHEQTAAYRPPEHPSTNLAKIFKRVHNSSFLIRYFTYITPLVLILLIPLLLGKLVIPRANVGGVMLFWFSIWLEIVWLTLWAGRLVAKMIPWPLGLVASLFTNNSKKWRDMGKQLEIPATIFFWWLGIEVSFLPTMRKHHVAGVGNQKWEDTMNKVIVAVFIGATLNFAEKVVIQLIAISFHLRTYADRIELNKFQIGSLVKLYQFSKEKIQLDDSDFEERDASGPASGTRTPMQYLDKAQKNVTEAFNKVGDVAGKVAGDFTGRTVAKSTHPHQVVLMLLNTTAGSQVLARRLYRTFVREGAETVFSDDLKNAFDNQEEADAAFSMFDKDLNGDISMEELEAVCVEIGRERKSITASLKDLDSVVSKLDAVLFFVVIIIFILSLITLVSTSAAGVLTSAGSTVLALSWLFSATAQEFLQSVIFVFVKHPFDVGDRVTIYGNTGSMMRGDDYFVKEISLLYTEFKKMEGHMVQAPNSYLNTLFILNMRRSGGLAEAVPVTIRFGTTLEQIDALRLRLLEFVKAEKREYQGNILTEIRDVVEAYAINLNVVFFYKSNWQNELLRLQRRNKFICAMMVSMQEIGIQGPRANIPGRTSENPYYINQQAGLASTSSNPSDPSHQQQDPAFVPSLNKRPSNASVQPQSSILRNGASIRATRSRGESVSAMSRRVDFSLGMKDVASGNLMGDVYDDEPNQGRLPDKRVTSPSHSRSVRHQNRIEEEARDNMEADENEKKIGKLGRSASRSERGSATSPSKRSKFGLHRSSTDNEVKGRTASVTHKNRFFGKKARERAEAESEYQDLMMESGMAEIPEGEGGRSRDGSVGSTGRPRGDNNALLPRWEERKDGENYEMRRLV